LKTKLSLLPKKLFRIRMSRNFGMKMLTMTNLSTECLIQLTKLGYDATPFNQILKQNAKREMRRSEERFSRNAETDLVCRLLLDSPTISISLPSTTLFRTTKNQAVATSQEAVQNQNEPQLRDENAHNDKSVHGVLNPTYQAGLRRDAVQPDIEAERKKRDE